MNIKNSFTPLLCFIVSVCSHIFNLGFIRISIVYFIFPVVLVVIQNIMFFVVTILYNKITHNDRTLYFSNIAIYVSYMLSNLTLPDTYGDGFPGMLLFSTIHFYNSNLFELMIYVSLCCWLLNMFLIIYQFFALKTHKRNL